MALADALSVLVPIRDSLLAKDYAVQIAGRVHAREQDVIDQLARMTPPRADRVQTESAQPAEPVVREENLPQAELNRRRFEREFLSLMAQRPDLGLAHVDALAQTQWHEQAHALVAQSMLDTLVEKPDASPVRVITDAQNVLPAAASILTSGSMADETAPGPLASFLVEELAIGDIEEAVVALRAQLAQPANLSPEDYEMLFETVAAMQKDLNCRRMAHKPLAPR